MNTNVQRRLKLLAAGHIIDLHAEMMERPRSKPTTHAKQADIDEWNELHFLPTDESP
jgi:hypothetical protein